MAEYVPEVVSDEIVADFTRMDAAGMQPEHISECLQLLQPSERRISRHSTGFSWSGLDQTCPAVSAATPAS